MVFESNIFESLLLILVMSSLVTYHLQLVGRSINSRGDSAYETGGDARRKFGIKVLKETDLGVAQAFFDP